jgi:HEPN domain-containing protein
MVRCSLAEPLSQDEGRQRIVTAWWWQSEHDLADARFVTAFARDALACFLCHQSAEKAVTAYLLARGAERVWGHALADLCEDALALDPSFDLIKTVAVLLDKHYLGARYPTALPGGVPSDAYDSHDSERAIEIAEDVRRSVLERLEALGLAPTPRPEPPAQLPDAETINLEDLLNRLNDLDADDEQP